jgi:hypothetical protein
MSSRALSLATVLLLIGCVAAGGARAQVQNLEAGKSPSQIFAQTCNACHKSPRGLVKSVPAGSLPGFLRQHYTTSSDMAGLLSSYLISNGATDPRYTGTQPKGGRETRPSATENGPPEQVDRFGRRVHPRTSPPEEPRQAAKPSSEGPAQATGERGPEGRKPSAKQNLTKRGKPGAEEPPKGEAAKEKPAGAAPVAEDKSKDESAKSEPAKSESTKSEPAKSEPAKAEAGKDDGRADSAKTDNAKTDSAKQDSVKPDTAKAEQPKEGGTEAPALRPDPAPAATPAPPAAVKSTESSSADAPEPPAAKPAEPAPPAATAVPSPPVPPAEPPLPPISK